MTVRLRWLTILSALMIALSLDAAAQDDDVDEDEEIIEEESDENFLAPVPPRFSRPSNGGGIAFGFGMYGLDPTVLDPALSGDLIFTGIDVYVMRSGLLLGGTWHQTMLYDPPLEYDEFEFGYKGVMLGLDYSLFYGKISVRPGVVLGDGTITMVKTRHDITSDTALNPNGREVLERLRDDDFFVMIPSLSIGWSPIDFIQFRAGASYFFPTKQAVEDLRKPMFTFQFVFGSNR